jgi:hypothetical protein
VRQEVPLEQHGPIVVRDLGKALAPVAAGVVHQDVEPAEALARRRDRALAGIHRRDVEREVEHLHARR